MSVGIMEATKCGVIVFVMAVFLAPSVIELSAAEKGINGRLCELPIKEATGMCGSKVPEKRWGYVPSKKKCFEYWYSKCESNQNGFATVKKCLEVCKRDSQCLKNPERPKLPYPFRFSTSWFFNASATECQIRKVTIATESKLKNQFVEKRNG
uniref:Putative bovine pancreatic trypsin inhibitor salivary gland overexpressed n=1 Tax=Rhipicephalus microplus TaxID=6941 RepID=A0A6M2D4M8_RHIMP